MSDHFNKFLLVVIIVDFCSYLNDISWKNKFAASTSKFIYPISSMLWSYIGELIFNMLILVGTVKMSDRIVKEMMGL